MAAGLMRHSKIYRDTTFHPHFGGGTMFELQKKNPIGTYFVEEET